MCVLQNSQKVRSIGIIHSVLNGKLTFEKSHLCPQKMGAGSLWDPKRILWISIKLAKRMSTRMLLFARDTGVLCV